MLKGQLELLHILKYQNELLLKQNSICLKNNIIINDLYSIITHTKQAVDDCYEKINTNNILLVCIFVLQIFILFK